MSYGPAVYLRENRRLAVRCVVVVETSGGADAPSVQEGDR
jgi:hypothetical protein